MSQVKHTPGPWPINRDGRFITSIGPISAEDYAGESWLKVSEEDSCLIAAAPELLEALIAITDKYADDMIGVEHSRPEIAEARVAIAKATGGQS